MTTSRAVAGVCTYFTFQERQFSKVYKMYGVIFTFIKEINFCNGLSDVAMGSKASDKRFHLVWAESSDRQTKSS